MKAKHENLCTGSNSLVIGMNNTCNHDDCLMIGTGLTTTMHGQVLIGNNKNVQSGAITPEDLREFKQILLQSLGGVTWQAEQSAELERLRKDAERWRAALVISQATLCRPDTREPRVNSMLNAYRRAVNTGVDMTGAIDAAIAAEGEKE